MFEFLRQRLDRQLSIKSKLLRKPIVICSINHFDTRLTKVIAVRLPLLILYECLLKMTLQENNASNDSLGNRLFCCTYLAFPCPSILLAAIVGEEKSYDGAEFFPKPARSLYGVIHCVRRSRLGRGASTSWHKEPNKPKCN